MTDRTPAETLTAAAEKLRGLIVEDELPTEPWLMHPRDPEVIVNPGGAALVTAYTPAIAAYIAAMHPRVAAALADWLDEAARSHAALAPAAASVWRRPEQAEERDAWVAAQANQSALAVARQLLGEAS